MNSVNGSVSEARRVTKSTTIVTVDSMVEWDSLVNKTNIFDIRLMGILPYGGHEMAHELRNNRA